MIRNVSMSSNDYVIWMLHIGEDLYIDSSSMLSFSSYECIQQIVAWFTTHTQSLFDSNTDKIISNSFEIAFIET